MATNGYHLDLKAFSLAQLKRRLTTTRLLPSQQPLRVNIDAHFACLEQQGIENLAQLQRALSTKVKMYALADQTGLPRDYLTLLRREVNSYQPKPVSFESFPGLSREVIDKLRQIGVKNTAQLFPFVLSPADRQEFAKRHQIEYETLLELTKLTDVVRMKWVGPKFARLLIESEYDTVEKVADSDPDALHQALVRVNEETGIYKGKFGIEDMHSWVNTVVQDVPRVIEY